MHEDFIAFILTVAGALCWVACFWWMHRISAKQQDLLEQLHEQGQRIEELSKIEHDLLIQEMHPQVSEIKASVDEMIATAKESQAYNSPGPATQKKAALAK